LQYSLDFKIGQMILVGFRGTEVNADSPIIRMIHDYHLGGVWLVDNDSPMGFTIGNIKSPGQVKKLTSDLQQTATSLPLVRSIDAEGGNNIRLKKKYGFLATHSAQSLEERNDLSLTRNQSAQIATTLKDVGINLNFAPVLDLNKNPLNPALGKKERCFSDNPEIVIHHAYQVIQAHQQRGILCCGKHFPGHGSATNDSHLEVVNVSNSWTDDELLPYHFLIKHNMLNLILTAHVFIDKFDNQYPATLSKPILTDLLRTELNYDNVIVSDDMNMGAIHNNYEDERAIELAIHAGVDIILQSNVANYDENVAECIFHIMKKLVKSGKVSERRIDESFERIKKVKKIIS